MTDQRRGIPLGRRADGQHRDWAIHVGKRKEPGWKGPLTSVGPKRGVTESGVRHGQADPGNRAGMGMEQVEGFISADDGEPVGNGRAGRQVGWAIERSSEQG